jgi:hypothetical protein
LDFLTREDGTDKLSRNTGKGLPLEAELYPRRVQISVFPLVVYGFETWSLTLREEHRLRVIENRVLKKILGLRGTREQGIGVDCIVRSFMICTSHQLLFG